MSTQLLIIGFVWPEPKCTAAGTRMLQLISEFKRQGYTITFATAAKTSERSADLSALGLDTVSIELNNKSFDDFLEQLKPDIVLFDRFMTEEQYGWRVAEICPNAVRLLDTEDFHGLRKARELAIKLGEKVSANHLNNAIVKREIASIYRCDLSLIISEAEMAVLIKRFNIAPDLLCYIPFLVDAIREKEMVKFPKFKERSHFISIGNFLHPPNYDAVLHLKTKIWPLIRSQNCELELHVYGAYSSSKVKQLQNSKEGFIIKGFTEDVNEVMQNYRVLLAPLRFGAGLKGKIIDAMVNGTPCAMTTIAAEGVFGDLDVNGIISDDITTFAHNAIELYENEPLWKSCQINGFKILNKRFNKIDFQEDFEGRLKELITNIDTHRNHNFIGSMLMHHNMQSTKYMSKWIEEKEKHKP